MLSLVTNLLFVLTGLALALATGYAAAVGERTGVVLLLFLALAALVTGLATVGQAVPDHAPFVPDDAPPPEPRATTTGAPARPSGWPLAAAAATTLLAAGAAIGLPVVLAGVVAVVVATCGWFAKAWSEHPTWTPRLRQRVSPRLLVPIGLPVGTFLLVAVIAVSVSRILLAVPEKAAVMVALLVAVAILLACAWVASRPRLASSALVALSAMAAVSMVGAGIAGAVSGEREFHHPRHEKEEDHLSISARQTQFTKSTLTVPAGKKVTLEFDNRDEAIFHNVAVYEGEGLQARPIFNGEGFPGHQEKTYELRVPTPGTYVFVCDFHPNMKGTLVAKAE